MEDSLSRLLADITRYDKNVLSLLNILAQSYNTDNDHVVMEWEDTLGNIQSYNFPSIKALMQQITEVRDTVTSLTSLSTRRAVLRLPGGDIKEIITTDLPTAPDTISNLQVPLVFYKKRNRTYEFFRDPLPFIKLDLTGKIRENYERVKVKTIIPILKDSNDVDFFNNNFLTNNIDYASMVTKFGAQAILFDEFEEILPIEDKTPRYSGSFNVISVGKRDANQADPTNPVIQNTTVYRLDTLLYIDNNTSSSVSLKTGDKLVLLSATSQNTIYEISYVDTGTNQVGVIRKEGFTPITIGASVLSIFNDYSRGLLVDVPIKSTENQIIFIKGINVLLNIEGADWGTGIGVNNASLIDAENLDLKIDLRQYENLNVTDYSKSLKVIGEQSVIPVSEALVPNTPVLSADLFIVDVTNDHIKGSDAIEKIKIKYGDKLKLEAEINKTNDLILELKTKIATDNTLTAGEITTTEQQLSDLYAKRSSKIKELSTKIDEINTGLTDNVVFAPKYAVRAFIPIPSSKYKDEKNRVGEQNVIALDTQYRYLSKQNTNKNNPVFKSIQNADGSTSNATFSGWISLPRNGIRKKDQTTGKWLPEDLGNADELNFNQINIPISRGENVEIRVRAISEVGYPYTEVVSNWSDPQIIPFPDSIIDDVNAIADASRNEQIFAKFRDEMRVLGLDIHTSDSLSLADKLYVHMADNIGTTSLTPENKPKTVQKVLNDYDVRIGSVEAKLAGDFGAIKVSVTDSLGKKLQDVVNNNQINLFAGYYKEAVAGLPVTKGQIVTTLYYVQITNTSDADLEILSFVPGSPSEPVPDNDQYLDPPANTIANSYYDAFDGYVKNVGEFNKYRKYWRAPVSYRAVTDNNTFKDHHNLTVSPFIELPAYQSQQVKGQIAYSRYRDVSLNKSFYLLDTTLSAQVLPLILSGVATDTFVWDGTTTPITNIVNGNGYLTDFCVHTDHPQIKRGTATERTFMDDKVASLLQGSGATIPFMPTITVDNSNLADIKVNYPYFYHNKYFNLTSSDTNGLYQLGYQEYTRVTSGTATIGAFSRRLGFLKDDVYLIGKNTCGSYLFLAADLNDSLWVKTTFYNDGMILKKGGIIRVPIIHQARLTDYYGAGSSGLGRVGGDPAKTNISYAKIIGIDIALKNLPLFSFDMRVEMQYAPTSASNVVQASTGGALVN